MIRGLIYGIPVLLGVLLIAAFLNATQLSVKKKNEMSIGSLGEPSSLNPIIGADAAASAVESTIFNGLLKYNADLEIIGDLAKSWTLRQTTTFFAATEVDARNAVERIQSFQDRWPEWSLEGVHSEGGHVMLDLATPGMFASEEIFKLLEGIPMVKANTCRITLKSSARESFDLFKKSAVTGHRIARVWFDTSSAYEVTIDGDPAPVLAELRAYYAAQPSLEAKIEEGESYAFLAEPEVTFQIRPGVRWHDGAPLTSRDAAFTYRAIMDETVASPRKPDFELILRVETPDDLTFRVIYRKPYSPALTSWMMPLLPAHILDGKPIAWWAQNFNRNPIGTGPFKFESWKTNEYLRVVRNPDYFGGGPWLDSMVFRMLADQLTLRLAFETGQVDFWSADPWAVGSIKDDPRYTVFSSPSNSYTYVGWNLRRPMFQDIRVRQAFAHAVNVPEMIRYILYGNGEQSTGIFTPQMWFFNPDIQPLAYDPRRAAELLDEAGWKVGPSGQREKDGKPMAFTLITNNANETRRDIAALVQDNLRGLGVTVTVESYEWVVFLTRFISKSDFDACVLGWSLSPDYDQYQIWHSSQSNPEQLNMVAYNNPRVDQMLRDIRQEYRRPEIIRIAGDLQRTIYEDQPYLFLYVPLSTTAIWKDSFRICRPGPDGGWIEEPVKNTKAGWSYWMEYFYRPEYPPHVLKPSEAGN